MNLSTKKPAVQRALIARDVRGILTVLTTDGADVQWMADEVGSGAEDVGLADDKDCPGPGLWLWTGTAVVENGGPPFEPPEMETVFHGAVRPVVADEVMTLLAMEPPPEPEDTV